MSDDFRLFDSIEAAKRHFDRIRAERRAAYAVKRVEERAARQRRFDDLRRLEAPPSALARTVLRPFSGQYARIEREGRPIQLYRERSTGRLTSAVRVGRERAEFRASHLARTIASAHPDMTSEEVIERVNRITQLRIIADIEDVDVEEEILDVIDT